jgi:hypothetical protein
MVDDIFAALRAAAKGSGWSVKQDILAKRVDGSVLAVHPRRGEEGIIEFRAKPVAWDELLWSILQIKGNEQKPASFHLIGAFTCDVPALVSEGMVAAGTDATVAAQMVELALTCHQKPSLWNGYVLADTIAAEQPCQPYRYHMTRVVERICSGYRQTAQMICKDAIAGALDCRRIFSSTDNLTAPDAKGCRPGLTFFELAQIWMSRH